MRQVVKKVTSFLLATMMVVSNLSPVFAETDGIIVEQNAILKEGKEVNRLLKSLVPDEDAEEVSLTDEKNKEDFRKEDTHIEAIRFAEDLPKEDVNTVELASDGSVIAWYEEEAEIEPSEYEVQIMEVTFSDVNDRACDAVSAPHPSGSDRMR